MSALRLVPRPNEMATYSQEWNPTLRAFCEGWEEILSDSPIPSSFQRVREGRALHVFTLWVSRFFRDDKCHRLLFRDTFGHPEPPFHTPTFSPVGNRPHT